MENKQKRWKKSLNSFSSSSSEFSKEHPNKYVVIVDNKVVGFFPNITEAILFSKRNMN